MKALSLAAIASVTALTGCASGPPPAALENRVFYQYDDQPSASGRNPFERPYPPLDKKAEGGMPEYIGVSILGGTAHISRPVNWKIRRASLTPERRYIEYVSPNEYLFAIYERTDSPIDPWGEVLARYEEDAKAKGAEIVGARVPIATWNAQGRQYVMKRTIKGQRAPYSHLSRESLIRSDHRIDLVEVVHQGESIAPVGGELLRVMETLELF